MRIKQDQRGISNVIVVMLSLVILVTIVANVVLWSYQMNQLDWEKMREGINIVDVRDTWPCTPSGYALNGSTSLASGSISNMASDDSIYMIFRSYYSGADITDFVDNNTFDVGSPADRGTHSNFTAQQYGPDGIVDTLLESNTGGGEPEQWISPTGYEDPGNEWADETNAYDDDTGTYAVDGVPGGDTWSQYLVLTHSAIICDKIRYYIGREHVLINQVEIDIYNGTWTNAYNGSGTWNTWANVSFTETSVTKMRFRFLNTHSTQKRMAYAYEADFLQSESLANYELDLEVQWIEVDYDEANEWLCIYGGTMGSENITVDVWYDGSWQNVFPDLSSGWNNVSVSSYLRSSTFTIRFKGSTETGDTIRDSWEVDVTLLHVWSDEYTSEVEFTGLGNMEDWVQLNWTVDSAWTVGLVNVTLQLYNYTLNGYLTGGNGYIAYTSDDAPNTDQTKSQTITVNPTHFRNATGYWRMKVKGVKATDEQFDLKVDWVEFKAVIASGTLFTFKNTGSLTSHLVSLWIINSTDHRRYDMDVILNSGETLPYLRVDISIPGGQYVVKVVTERGNIAVFSGG